ncbi:hypothetical protein [Neptunomonas sp.]|uniref:hypothetical protein n=1 Tax=Neptunomonas sp. TaxID=1971898 RepID=UPI00356776BC
MPALRLRIGFKVGAHFVFDIGIEYKANRIFSVLIIRSIATTAAESLEYFGGLFEL